MQTQADTQLAEPARQLTPTLHIICPTCFPDPQPGDVVTSLCGIRKAAGAGTRLLPVSPASCSMCVEVALATDRCPRCGADL